MIGANRMPYVKEIQPGDVIGYETGLLQKKEDGSHMVAFWNEQMRENPDSKLEHVQRAVIANMMHYDKGGADALGVLLGFNLKRILPQVTLPSLYLCGSRDCAKPPVFEPIAQVAGYTNSEIIRFKVIYGAGIMGWLDYPYDYAKATLEFLSDPEAYVGSAGHELDLAMQEYLVPIWEDLKFKDYNTYTDNLSWTETRGRRSERKPTERFPAIPMSTDQSQDTYKGRKDKVRLKSGRMATRKRR